MPKLAVIPGPTTAAPGPRTLVPVLDAFERKMGGGGTQGAGGGPVSGKAKKEAAEMFASMDLDEDGANRGSPY
jgi:hypothetical protein